PAQQIHRDWYVNIAGARPASAGPARRMRATIRPTIDRRPVLLVLVLLHLVAGALAPVLVRAWGSRAFLALALPPAATFVWALTVARDTLDATRVEEFSWVPALQMDLTLTLGPLQWLMTLVVAGIGALVLAYCAWYFSPTEPGLATLAGTLTAFAGAMLGLVWADNLLVLYVFW